MYTKIYPIFFKGFQLRSLLQEQQREKLWEEKGQYKVNCDSVCIKRKNYYDRNFDSTKQNKNVHYETNADSIRQQKKVHYEN